MSIFVTVKQEQQRNKFALSDFYKENIWDLTKHPQFSTLTDKQKLFVAKRKHIIDYTNCINNEIVNELKYYCQQLIEVENQKITSFITYIGGIDLIISFTNRNLERIESILDLEYNDAVNYFSEYLLKNGYKTHTYSHNAILENMQSKTYKQPTAYLRLFISFHKFIQEQYKEKSQKKNIFDEDKWDIRDLPFKIKGFDPSRPRYTISFENITQSKIKDLAKKFTFERLKTNKYLTCVDDLKGINYLSKFLHSHYPEINSLKQLDREIIEEFLGGINLTNELAPRTKSSRIGSIKTFFETCMLYGWDEAPEQTLLLSDDVKKKKKIMPKFYEDNVIYQINEHLENLPVQIARMVFILQNIGMRISELCTLTIDCIKQDTENDYLLEYYQEKTNEWNRVPIKKDVALAIIEAINHSKKQFGENIRYVFMQNKERPISKDTFSYHMNRLVKKFNITDSNGNLVRIKAHTFRGTVATNYANMGMSPNLIRILLGQKSLGAIRHYVEILEETITDSMQNILQFQDKMIQNIGNKEIKMHQNKEDEVEIPLPNGKCTKPISSGKCTHANACYTCAMFKPDPKNIDLFKYQLKEAKSNVEMAKINGFERIQQVNEDLVEALEKIISSIEKGGILN